MVQKIKDILGHLITGAGGALAIITLLAASGNIRWDQLATTARHGTGVYGQSSDGTGTSGNLSKYDANGNVVDGSIAASNVFDKSTDNDISTHYIESGHIAAPSSPGANKYRLFVDSTSHKVSCKDSGGSDCMPSGGSGALVLITQHSASGGASVDFTDCISSTYDTYELQFLSLLPATTSSNFFLQYSADGGSNWITTNSYSWVSFGNSTGGTSFGGSTSASGIGLGFSNEISNNSSWAGLSGNYYLYSPGSTSVYKRISGIASYFNTGANGRGQTHNSGAYEATSAVNAFRIIVSSGGGAGNITSGTVRCYGLTK